MSSYQRQTKHPLTGAIEDAQLLDDYFGRHHYGVKFSGCKVFRADLYEWVRNPATDALEPHLVDNSGQHTYMLNGKEFTEAFGKDGRKDVTVRVNRLDLHPKSPEEAHAKEQIEEHLLPKLGEMVDAAMVRVIVLHHGTELRHAEHDVKLSQVRAYAEQVVKAFRESFPSEQWTRNKDFTIVEVHHDSYTTRVSTLEEYGK